MGGQTHEPIPTAEVVGTTDNNTTETVETPTADAIENVADENQSKNDCKAPETECNIPETEAEGNVNPE